MPSRHCEWPSNAKQIWICGWARQAAYKRDIPWVCRGPHSGHGDTNGSYDAYMQANVAYQASQDPEYQALLAKQQALREDDSGAMPPPPPPADVRIFFHNPFPHCHHLAFTCAAFQLISDSPGCLMLWQHL